MEKIKLTEKEVEYLNDFVKMGHMSLQSNRIARTRSSSLAYMYGCSFL
ncbi:MAG: hypothetical protein AEth_00930 [Candidatus Argoarchaeum ethanivorans]|uniref:Uncharacterized protein n=1 Tax=Candidatus Argoarchaeum ethanivorans TaxID=2608793 RepID=A0A8B3S214_9EURY|nr:MAG: hypothetical protein AEth_00930 [Candidatus Argoarchaeum ethanivorans]